jgi:hypothetical protein
MIEIKDVIIMIKYYWNENEYLFKPMISTSYNHCSI